MFTWNWLHQPLPSRQCVVPAPLLVVARTFTGPTGPRLLLAHAGNLDGHHIDEWNVHDKSPLAWCGPSE